MQLIPLPAPQTLIHQEVEFSPLFFHLQGVGSLDRSVGNFMFNSQGTPVFSSSTVFLLSVMTIQLNSLR